jgi:hypothetical protein
VTVEVDCNERVVDCEEVVMFGYEVTVLVDGKERVFDCEEVVHGCEVTVVFDCKDRVVDCEEPVVFGCKVIGVLVDGEGLDFTECVLTYFGGMLDGVDSKVLPYPQEVLASLLCVVCIPFLLEALALLVDEFDFVATFLWL